MAETQKQGEQGSGQEKKLFQVVVYREEAVTRQYLYEGWSSSAESFVEAVTRGDIEEKLVEVVEEHAFGDTRYSTVHNLTDFKDVEVVVVDGTVVAREQLAQALQNLRRSVGS
jgi:metal-responsive CopG/Arc/MetJ family transcriptional regulator